jgi:hypothetical protein
MHAGLCAVQHYVLASPDVADLKHIGLLQLLFYSQVFNTFPHNYELTPSSQIVLVYVNAQAQ